MDAYNTAEDIVPTVLQNFVLRKTRCNTLSLLQLLQFFKVNVKFGVHHILKGVLRIHFQ